jgi:trehalose 6-phosphate synthase
LTGRSIPSEAAPTMKDVDTQRSGRQQDARAGGRFTLGSWVRSVGASLRPLLSAGRGGPVPGSTPIIREIKQLVRDLNATRRLADDARIQWTPNTLSLILQNELPDAEVVVVSNREPYSHEYAADGSTAVQTPASGLVAALEPVTVACGGTWIAHGSGAADRETVDASDRLRVPPDDPAYSLRRVWLSEEEEDGYYYGYANEGLWPLCHLAYVRPTFRAGDWDHYVGVNRKFAEAVVNEARTAHPILLVQDYHFALLPQMVRKLLPEATIITFWHIPWPNAETFGICPQRAEVMKGLLGSSILGFHTQYHCNNFFETADRFLESRIDRERSSVTFGGEETLVRPYPISIHWPAKALARQEPVDECHRIVRERFGLPADIRLAVGIERFDYTKGILDRMRAVDGLLTLFPEWRGRFSFVQAAAPTRTKLAAYRSLQDEAVALAEEINGRHRDDGAPAIILSVRHHGPDEVFELFRAAEVCIVSSLHDGMNLVAKEFVAARDDEQGVLVLSSFAGASRELIEALIVNPYDADGMARSLHQALVMPADEQRERMRLMREMVNENNVYRWAGRMLLDAARVRRSHRITGLMTSARVSDDQAG